MENEARSSLGEILVIHRGVLLNRLLHLVVDFALKKQASPNTCKFAVCELRRGNDQSESLQLHSESFLYAYFLSSV